METTSIFPRRYYAAVVWLLAAVLCGYGCGSGGSPSYDNVSATRESSSPLIAAATLNGWIQNGFSDEYGYTKMVILDVTSAASYAAGHVPGAYLMDTGTALTEARSEGPGKVLNMVLRKSTIEGFLRSVGVDDKTVIVLTGDEIKNTGRAYFTLLYWGLPNNRVKVLDGTNQTYMGAGYTLEKTTPAVSAYSDFSICQFAQNTSYRATLQEMIQVARGEISDAIIVDVRSADEYNGVAGKSKWGSYTPAQYELFEGHIRGAINMEYKKLLTNNDGEGDNGFLPLDQLRQVLSSYGIDGTKTVYLYCHTGTRAGTTFLVLRTLLGYTVKLYDGSWQEWGMMSDRKDAAGAQTGTLTADSPWRTNLPTLSESITYNQDSGKLVGTMDDVRPYSARADLINEEDSSTCSGGGSDGSSETEPQPGC